MQHIDACVDLTGGMDTGDKEVEIPEIQAKRRQGRPTTTGDYQRKLEREQREAEGTERQRERDILDPHG